MAKRDTTFNVVSAPGEFPVIIESAFNSTPKSGPRERQETRFLFRAHYKDWSQVLHRAIRATTIDAQNIAVDGQFPFREEEYVDVDYRGEPMRTLDDEVADFKAKTADEQEALLHEVQKKLAAMQAAYAVQARTISPETRNAINDTARATKQRKSQR